MGRATCGACDWEAFAGHAAQSYVAGYEHQRDNPGHLVQLLAALDDLKEMLGDEDPEED